ncbi:MAG: DUF2007 domain-containing protein [Acidobacteria bacterium]|jgi:hypothetical protein|nr:DUF2007 domain-containing protein [Acidobacteriota bacterium]
MDDRHDSRPPDPGAPPPELVLAARFANVALVPLAKSMLDGAGIPFYTRNELTQDLIGWGRFGAMFNPLVGMVEFWVPADQVDAARRVLGELGPEDDPA